MPWGRVDDSHYDHDKVLQLPADIRNECVGLYWRSISYSNAKLTDGQVTEAVVEHLNGRPETVDALVTAKLWHRRRGGGSFVIHDFADFNQTRAEVQASRDKKVEAGRLGGLRSGEARGKRKRTNGKARASRVLELPTRPDSSTESPTPTPPPRAGRGRKNGQAHPASDRGAQADALMQRDDDPETGTSNAWSDR